MTFRNSVVGGTTLVRPAIKSPNFVTGVSGWSIDRNGSAEFNDITIRGSNGSAAITIGPSTGPQVVIDSTASAGYIEFPTNAPGERTTARIAASVANSGGAAEALTLTVRGPAENGAGTDRIDIIQRSDFQDGSSEAQFRLDLNGSSTLLIVDKTNGLQLNRQLLVQNLDTAASPFRAVTPGGQTADLLDLQVGGTDEFVVSAAGILTTYAANTFSAYTPTWTNLGTATQSVNTGWYQKVGKMVFFTAYSTFNGAGSGAGDVTVTAPSSIDRTTRQIISLNYSNVFGAGNVGNGNAVSFTGGTGAVIDKLRASDQGAANSDATITGVDITASSIITISGWYREA